MPFFHYQVTLSADTEKAPIPPSGSRQHWAREMPQWMKKDVVYGDREGVEACLEEQFSHANINCTTLERRHTRKSPTLASNNIMDISNITKFSCSECGIFRRAASLNYSRETTRTSKGL